MSTGTFLKNRWSSHVLKVNNFQLRGRWAGNQPLMLSFSQLEGGKAQVRGYSPYAPLFQYICQLTKEKKHLFSGRHAE